MKVTFVIFLFMRTLYLLRHAKSSWKDVSLADFERPLKGRGRDAAERMGLFMASKKVNISALIVSPAVRTRQTIEIYRGCEPYALPKALHDRLQQAIRRHRETPPSGNS